MDLALRLPQGMNLTPETPIRGWIYEIKLVRKDDHTKSKVNVLVAGNPDDVRVYEYPQTEPESHIVLTRLAPPNDDE